MDFSVINDFPSQSSPGSKQITVIHAENGSLYEYPYIKFVSPIGLKRGNYLTEFVEKEYGVSKANQFILRSDDGKLLDNNVTLEDFFRKVRFWSFNSLMLKGYHYLCVCSQGRSKSEHPRWFWGHWRHDVGEK